MGGPIPALGYPSRTDAVLAMTEAGKSVREIATALDIDTKTVHGLRASASRYRQRRPRPSPHADRAILVSRAEFEAARVHASRRGVTPNALLRRLVVVALEHGLVDAILDDRGA